MSKQITEEDCQKLATKILTLRSQDAYYKYKLSHKRIADDTGLPQGSLDYYIRLKRLPIYNYVVLKDYVDKVIETHKVWLENPSPLNKGV